MGQFWAATQMTNTRHDWPTLVCQTGLLCYAVRFQCCYGADLATRNLRALFEQRGLHCEGSRKDSTVEEEEPH